MLWTLQMAVTQHEISVKLGKRKEENSNFVCTACVLSTNVHLLRCRYALSQHFSSSVLMIKERLNNLQFNKIVIFSVLGRPVWVDFLHQNHKTDPVWDLCPPKGRFNDIQRSSRDSRFSHHPALSTSAVFKEKYLFGTEENRLFRDTTASTVGAPKSGVPWQ